MFSETKWGKRLAALLAAIPGSRQVSEHEVQPGEEVVGVLPDALRRLGCLTDDLLQEHNALVVRHNSTEHECNPEGCEQIAIINDMHDDYAFLIKMFIKAVQEEFDIKGKIIGIRAGNRAVLGPDQNMYRHGIGILGDGRMIPVGAPLA